MMGAGALDPLLGGLVVLCQLQETWFPKLAFSAACLCHVPLFTSQFFTPWYVETEARLQVKDFAKCHAAKQQEHKGSYSPSSSF